MRNIMKKLCLIFILIPGLVFASENLVKGQDFINQLSKDVIGILETKISQHEKQEKLRSLFKKNVNTKWIGKFALGKYFRNLNKEQKSQYLELYSDFITENYIVHFKKFDNQYVNILTSQDLDDGDIFVKTEIRQHNNPSPIKIDYLIRFESGNPLIYDIVAENVSLIAAQRSEFNSVVSNEGIDFLLDMLRKKVGKL